MQISQFFMNGDIATQEPKGYVTLVKDLELPECFIMTLQNTYQQSEFSDII